MVDWEIDWVIFVATTFTEVWVIFFELSRAADLPHVIKLLDRHLSVAFINSGSQIPAGVEVNLIAKIINLMIPVLTVLRVDFKFVVELQDLASISNLSVYAPLWEPLAKLLTFVRVPATEVFCAVSGISGAVALCSFPEQFTYILVLSSTKLTILSVTSCSAPEKASFFLVNDLESFF